MTQISSITKKQTITTFKLSLSKAKQQIPTELLITLTLLQAQE